MSKPYVVTFFGVEKNFNVERVCDIIPNVVEDVIIKYRNVEFIAGLNGEYDKLIYDIIQEKINFFKSAHCTLTLLAPQFAQELNDLKALYPLYDKLEIVIDKEVKTLKQATKIRNTEAIKRSDFIVFYSGKQEELSIYDEYSPDLEKSAIYLTCD